MITTIEGAGLDLICELGMARLEKRRLETQLELLNAELATSLIRTEDLHDALEETCEWIAWKTDSDTPGQYRRWAGLL